SFSACGPNILTRWKSTTKRSSKPAPIGAASWNWTCRAASRWGGESRRSAGFSQRGFIICSFAIRHNLEVRVVLYETQLEEKSYATILPDIRRWDRDGSVHRPGATDFRYRSL